MVVVLFDLKKIVKYLFKVVLFQNGLYFQNVDIPQYGL